MALPTYLAIPGCDDPAVGPVIDDEGKGTLRELKEASSGSIGSHQHHMVHVGGSTQHAIAGW